MLWIDITDFAVNDFRIKTLGIIIGFGGMNISTWLKYLLGAIASVLFFATLLFHEFSHSFVARRYGTKIRNITLFVLGGVAQMEEMLKEPRKEAKVAAAGPAFSMSIGIIASATGLFGLLTLPGGVWLLLIAIFIYFGASAEEQATIIPVSLGGVKARDVMKREIISIGPDADASDALKLISIKNIDLLRERAGVIERFFKREGIKSGRRGKIFWNMG